MNPQNETQEANQVPQGQGGIPGNGNNIQGSADHKGGTGSAVGQVVLTEHEEPQISADEEKELTLQLEHFSKYPKLMKWSQLFLDKDNKATYGNRTESAMQAYDCKSRVVAANIGSQNYRKLYGLASIFAEDRGVTLESLLEVLSVRALTHENPEWWKLAAEVFGYRDPKAQSLVINNTQNNTQVNIDAADKEDFNAKFKKFLEAE